MEGEEALLEEILERGWSGKGQREFIRRYGQTIRWSILYYIRMRFGDQNLRAVSDYLLALQEGKCPHSKGGVVGEILDLAADTWQDVINEVFKTKDSLIHKYRRYVADERGSISFPHFLSKSVYYKFLDNLSPGLSDKEILDRIVDAKREADRQFYINEFRNRYRDRVEDSLRDRYPGLRRINNIMDYFFERFIPQAYPAIRQALGSKTKKAVLDLLLEGFSRDDCQRGSGYTRRVYGGVTEMGTSLPDSDVEEDLGGKDRAEAEGIPLNNEVNYYWDRLIRCRGPDPEEIERELVRIDPNEGNVLCWACARLKRRFRRKEQRENLRAFITFYCSKRGVGRMHPSAGRLTLEKLTLERVVGRDLRWREDICRGIFRKYIRKDRVMEQIKEEIMNSDYGYLISE